MLKTEYGKVLRDETADYAVLNFSAEWLNLIVGWGPKKTKRKSKQEEKGETSPNDFNSRGDVEAFGGLKPRTSSYGFCTECKLLDIVSVTIFLHIWISALMMDIGSADAPISALPQEWH